MIGWELFKKFKFNHIVYTQTIIHSRKLNPLGFWDRNGPLNPKAKRPDRVIIKKKKCHKEEVAIPANHKVKIKESEKIEK